jgi:hypothetical protein
LAWKGEEGKGGGKGGREWGGREWGGREAICVIEN